MMTYLPKTCSGRSTGMTIGTFTRGRSHYWNHEAESGFCCQDPVRAERDDRRAGQAIFRDRRCATFYPGGFLDRPKMG